MPRVDEQSLQQIRSFWPDVAAPFSRVIPEGCYLVRTVDDWVRGLRKRLVDLARYPNCPPLDELVEEAQEDAERRGWTPVDELSHEGERVLELEDVLLRIGAASVQMIGGPIEVLRVSFDQPWPIDAGPPVQTSEMFQNLVRKLLRLGSDPTRLIKEVIVEAVLREIVRMSLDHPLDADLAKLSFARDGDFWRSETSSGQHVISAFVREPAPGEVEVEMIKQLIASS